MNIVYNLSRSISTCGINFNQYAAREGKFMAKIMRGEQDKRKWFRDSGKKTSSAVTTNKPILPQSNRRNDVLNKIFMKYITDLMATGEVAPDIVGKGIQVTRVSVTPDFRQINVFWLAGDANEEDKLIENVLMKAEGPLRHELSQLRVMGVVPIIKFVKDKYFLRFVEIDKRLAVADYGEDFVPTDRTLHLKASPVLKIKLPADVRTDIEKLEQNLNENESESVEEILPEMRNDVLGLDHARIMAKIKSSMDKSKAAYQNRSLNMINRLPRITEQSSKVTEHLSGKQKIAAFSAFLTKRHLEEKQRKKSEMNKYNTNDELYAIDHKDSNDDDEILDIDIHLDEFQER